MASNVTFNNDKYPKGTEFAVGDYFLAKNGETVEVDDATEGRYKAETGKTLKQGLGKSFKVDTIAVTKVEGGEKA